MQLQARRQGMQKMICLVETCILPIPTLYLSTNLFASASCAQLDSNLHLSLAFLTSRVSDRTKFSV